MNMNIPPAIGNPSRVTPIVIELNIPNAKQIRYGATQRQASLEAWQPYQTKIQTYGRGDNSKRPLDYYAEVKLKDGSIVKLYAIEKPRLPGKMIFPRASINTDFHDWNNQWVSYGYDVNNHFNTFYPYSMGHNYGWVDDSRWGLDTPEYPQSVLFAMNYMRWISDGKYKYIDLSNTTMTVDLDLSGVDLKGGKVDFWVVAADKHGHGRYHDFAQPLHDGHNEIKLKFRYFENSWLDGNRARGSVILDPTKIESWGFSFTGFESVPTGVVKMTNFKLK